jgi:hypothetical protein
MEAREPPKPELKRRLWHHRRQCNAYAGPRRRARGRKRVGHVYHYEFPGDADGNDYRFLYGANLYSSGAAEDVTDSTF